MSGSTGTLDSTPGLPLESPPSFRQGWGRVDLLYSLPLQPNDSRPLPFTLWTALEPSLASVSVSDSTPDALPPRPQLPSLRQSEEHAYCIQMPKSIASDSDSSNSGSPPEPLSATLTWYDPPSAPSIGYRALINDLDLTLDAPPSEPLADYGAADRPDRLNTAERAAVRDPMPGASYRLGVRGYLVPWFYDPGRTGAFAGQPYALVVTAPANASVCRIGVESDDGCPADLECPREGQPRPQLQLQLQASPAAVNASTTPSGASSTRSAVPGLVAGVSTVDPPLHVLATAASAAAAALSGEPLAPAAPDPCLCSEDGQSGGVLTPYRGCSPFLFASAGIAQPFCFTTGGLKCEGASPSTAYVGAAIRICTATAAGSGSGSVPGGSGSGT